MLSKLKNWLFGKKKVIHQLPAFPVTGRGPFVIAFFDDGSYTITNQLNIKTASEYIYQGFGVTNSKRLIKVIHINNIDHLWLAKKDKPLVCGDELVLHSSF